MKERWFPLPTFGGQGAPLQGKATLPFKVRTQQVREERWGVVGLVPVRGHVVINDAPRGSPGNRVWPPWNAGQAASEWPAGMALGLPVHQKHPG